MEIFLDFRIYSAFESVFLVCCFYWPNIYELDMLPQVIIDFPPQYKSLSVGMSSVDISYRTESLTCADGVHESAMREL